MTKKQVKIPLKREGAMTRVATSMGYEHVTDIPRRLIRTYCNKLVAKYGERKALGMVRAQLIMRKNQKASKAQTWFIQADSYIRTKYAGDGWTPPKRRK